MITGMKDASIPKIIRFARFTEIKEDLLNFNPIYALTFDSLIFLNIQFDVNVACESVLVGSNRQKYNDTQ